LGRWIAERNVRDRVVLITKGAHPLRGVCRVDPASIEADIDASLSALGVDYIDLYLLHRDEPSAPVGPILEVLNEQRSAGRLHAFGASNWDHRRIAEANDYATAHRLIPFVASSPQFGLLAPARIPWPGTVSIGGQDGAAARAWYIARRMPVLAWSCLAGGLLGGRRPNGAVPASGRSASSSCGDAYLSAHNARVMERAAELARARRWTIAQVALSWILGQPGLDTYAVIGCRSGEELRRDAEALQLGLSAREIAWLGFVA
jgi:aryl-alcohol dehydrogenase-like predicted oxidoreductase